MSYNGWTNYETWAVNLWIENDPHTYEHKIRLAREIAREEVERDRAIYRMAEALKEWVTDWVRDQLTGEASLASDLLTAALSEVDWTEIAVASIDEEWRDVS